MTTIKKIVLLTSGGDAPGMNAAIRAVVRTALHHNIQVLASENGFMGLIEESLIELNARDVGNIIQRGGTILKTGRTKAFHDQAIRDKARSFLQREKIDGLIILGGDGSFRGAALLHAEGGPPIIGIPCTIDNDITGTDYTIGFDTARNTALDAIDKIRDTAFSLDRHFMIEIMGRATGFLAVDVGIAGGAEHILIPEFPIELEALCAKLKNKNAAKQGSIMVVAEANQPGHTIALAQAIKERTNIEYRVCILGHIQRGGCPTVKDRVCASLMGAQAIEHLIKHRNSKMMAEVNTNIVAVDFAEPKNATRYFEKAALIEINNVICDV